MVSKGRKKSELKKEGKETSHQKAQKNESARLIKDSPTDPQARNYLKRRRDIIPPLKKFLIVCEGKKTEPGYFEAMRDIWRIPVLVEILEAQGNTLSVVQAAASKRGEHRLGGNDETWAVFDRDSFEPWRISAAFDLAKAKGVKIAFSNEAFELWFLLHYHARSTGLSRASYETLLSRYLGRRYEKNCPDMFAILRSNLPTAIRNAMRLSSGTQMYAPELINLNPYTGVHLLIKSMLPDEERMQDYINRSLINITSDEYQRITAAF